MRLIPVGPLAALLLLGLAAPARAGFINGGYESGLTGWEKIGDALTKDSSFGLTPTQGLTYGLITTASALGDDDGSGKLPFSGTDAVLAADLRAFLGLDLGTVVDGYEGSALRQTFTAEAGDMLTLSYNFLTTERGRVQ